VGQGNVLRWELQGALGKAPRGLDGTGSEWKKELGATAFMAATELWLCSKGKHGRAFIAGHTVGRRFVHTKAMDKSRHGHDVGRYEGRGDDVRWSRGKWGIVVRLARTKPWLTMQAGVLLLVFFRASYGGCRRRRRDSLLGEERSRQ
jgi:hypothetical protein